VAIRCEENLSRNVSNERGKNHLHARFIRRLKPRLGQIREPLRAHAFAERAFQRTESNPTFQSTPVSSGVLFALVVNRHHFRDRGPATR